MAKKTVRVHQIAKSLGVTSKDVVAKCLNEGIPDITNHMSTVSAGLSETIKEWFGESDTGGTAIQTAPKVDVEAARAKASKARRSKKPAPVDEPVDPAPDAPAEQPPTEETLDIAAVTETPATQPPMPDAPEVPTPTAITNLPKRPDVIVPAGRKLEQPVKTRLSGPKIVRVETPDITHPPPPRRERSTPQASPPGPPPDTRPDNARRDSPPSRRNRRRSGTGSEAPARAGRHTTRSGEPERPFNWREQDLLERERRLSHSGGFFRAARRDSLRRTESRGTRATTAAQEGGAVSIEEPINVKALSAATGIKANQLLRQLILAQAPATINSTIDTEMARKIMQEWNIELQVVEQKTAGQRIVEHFRDRTAVDERPRSPIVTILGHVDHGKTSLLDRIRSTKVAEGEAGGITQATSAFRVPVKVGDADRLITFIDTPGHQAFTEMRARGARVTDIVVLVVAADDGVMPQTVESINHAADAGVPIVVALNKIDKPEATDANIQRILGQLAEHELNPVEWGGATELVRTCATDGTGIQDLLEVLDYQAQLLELTADHGGPAEGTVLEAHLEEGRGPVVNLLVQQGVLSKGDCIVLGRGVGRVRDIIDDHGDRIESAEPSMPVVVFGFDVVPDAGDRFYIVDSLKDAERAASEHAQAERERDLSRTKVSLDNIFEHMAESAKKELPILLKADVQGSVETIRSVLQDITSDEVTIAVKHAAVGGINDSDIALSEASGAIIIGFNVTTSAKARKHAKERGVDIRLYEVIYDITDDVKKAAVGLLEPEIRLEVIGHADVREVFRVSKTGMVAGCFVTDGKVERNARIRVTREDIVVESDRKLDQLKRFKDDVKEVRAGQECGMRIEGYDDIKVGDVIECYLTREVQREL